MMETMTSSPARITMPELLGADLLLSIGQFLHREIAMDDLLKRLVDRIAAMMSADRGTIYLVDRTKGEVFSKAAHLPELEEIRLRIGQGVAGRVAETGEIINVPTAHGEARFYRGVDEQTGYTTKSLLAVPVRDREGAIIGVVQLLNKEGGTFLRSDESVLEALASEVAIAIEATTLYRELSRAPEQAKDPIALSSSFNLIVGDSQPMRAACRLTKKAAASEATVLIRGESGTGKELFARAIHVNSARRDGPLVKVDCAALPESLIENELFGHERGAYTGADQRAHGKFDAAKGGTIFLDEIGELPLAVQGKLLRVLQDREFQRVGGTAVEKADVRVVCATNRDLVKFVEEGRFRGDLYYRIKVVELNLPPLRERGEEDIARLARHFVELAARRHGRRVPQISGPALGKLTKYPWPGNVRELENCVESAVVVMEGERIEAADVPLVERSSTVAREDDQRVRTLEEVEREHIERVLAKADGNRTLAAKLLGIGRNTLQRKLSGWGL